MTREEAIARIREKLVSLTDEENCMCKVAGDRGIFCNGFRQFGDKELRERYWWIVRKRPDITRAELETIANDWQLAQQDVRELPVACDVQTKVHDTCRGWNDFSNEQLGLFVKQLTGEEATVK
ncbi:MAG: hypothetical protein ACXW31_12590 [Thermoanaerobaculia bacterium]